MANMTGSAKRYRLQVPAADESVQRWLAEQLNISSSLRQLIRDDIQRNGYTDVTCRAVEQGAKRGRPSNAELERRQEQTQREEAEQPIKQSVVQVKQEVAQTPQKAVQTVESQIFPEVSAFTQQPVDEKDVSDALKSLL